MMPQHEATAPHSHVSLGGAVGGVEVWGGLNWRVLDRLFNAYTGQGSNFHFRSQLVVVVRFTHQGANDAQQEARRNGDNGGVG